MGLGASGVIATLWPVDDLATSLLMAKFYELHMSGGLPPPTALKRAQDWLRNASRAELAAYIRGEAARTRIGASVSEIIRRTLAQDVIAGDSRRTRSVSLLQQELRSQESSPEPPKAADSEASLGPDDRPYSHPYYWGGFIYLGM